MDETLNIGDRVTHADCGDAVAVLVRYYAGWDVVVRWESTGRESTVNIGYLTRV
jgi:hypothetical protein